MANEKRLIDANALRRRIEAFVATVRYKGINNVPTGYESCNPTEYMRGYERGVMDTYTVAVKQQQVDAVEVVRCKDCKHFDSKMPYCLWHYIGCSPYDFCSYGELKDSEE